MLRIVRLTELRALEDLFKFRYRMYVEVLGWVPTDSTGLLRDDFDDFADNYAAYDESGSVVGSIRVVPDGPLGLPLERYAPVLNGFRDGKRLVEFSRLVVDRNRSGPRLGGLLMKAGFQRAELLDASHVVLDTAVDSETVHLYEKMGFEQIGGTYIDAYHRGEMRSATMAQPVSSVRREWTVERPGLSKFFLAADPNIVHGAVPEESAL